MNFRIARRQDDVEINFIPLIDVLVVLLIFLMVTTTFNHLGTLSVELPQAAAEPPPTEPSVIQLGINATGEYAVEGRTLHDGTRAGLAAALSAARKGRDEVRVVLSADRRTAHERVILAMEAARAAGLTHLSFAVATPAGAPASE